MFMRTRRPQRASVCPPPQAGQLLTGLAKVARLGLGPLLIGLSLACSSPELGDAIFACGADSDCAEGQSCRELNGTPVCVGSLESGNPCTQDRDCATNDMCNDNGRGARCEPIPTTPIVLGMSAPFQGPSSELGEEMRRGVQAMMLRVNQDEGGLFGRTLELQTRNDSYDPAAARDAVRDLLDVRRATDSADEPDERGPNSVFALLGCVGTPTMLETAPIATKNRVLFFAPFTGALQYLRDGTDSPYVYNYRASYYDEAAAIVDYLAESRVPRVIQDGKRDYERLLVFSQNDSYGNAGYQGILSAYNSRVAALPAPDAIARVTYERDDLDSVDPAIEQAQQYLTRFVNTGAEQAQEPTPVAVVLVDTYRPGNKFTRAVKDWIHASPARARALDVLFIHISFVGSDSLAQALTSDPTTHVDGANPTGPRRSYAEGVMVTQVVPGYEGQAESIVEYRRDLGRSDQGSYSFTSLEGYIATKLFVEAVRANGPRLTTERLRATLDGGGVRDLDIGIGTLLSFSPDNRQASSTVWLSEISDEGRFTVPWVWNPVDRIQPN